MDTISSLKDGTKIRMQVLVASKVKGVTNNGLSYLNLELRDNTGQINAKKWEVSSEDEEIFTAGNIIEVYGEVITYKNSLQMKVLGANKVETSEIDTSRFVKTSPIDFNLLKDKFNRYIDSIKNSQCQLIVKTIVNKYRDKIYTYPAAVSIHHDYLHGLLTHTTTMCDIGHYLCSIYNDVNEDLLISGIILHDIGKTVEFEGDILYQYSLEGKLVGHISIMSAILHETASSLGIKGEVVTLLEHMILSHHGQLEFGSPVLPLTQEALLLSLIDSLDSKMVCLNKAYENVNEGEFTQKLFSFDGRSFYKPKIK